MEVFVCSQAFVEHYYKTFDTNRGALAGLYQENGILTFEVFAQTFNNEHELQKLHVWPVCNWLRL